LGIKITSLHPMSWPTDLIEGKLVKEEQSCVILCGVWAVWTERNVVCHGERGRPIVTSVHWALARNNSRPRTSGQREEAPSYQTTWRMDPTRVGYYQDQCRRWFQ
jgi:hypothetical protein